MFSESDSVESQPQAEPQNPAPANTSPVQLKPLNIPQSAGHHLTPDVDDDNVDDSPLLISTPSPDHVAELPPEQYRAMMELCDGRGISAAARAARVTRTTIYRWQKHDARFIAALNLWQRQTRAELDLGFTSLVPQSLKTITQAVENGNVAASLAVVRYVRALDLGSGNPHFIAEELKYRRKRIAARVYKMRALPEAQPAPPDNPPLTPSPSTALPPTPERAQANAAIGAMMAGLIAHKANELLK